MRYDKELLLSATDLSKHLGCRRLTELDLEVATRRRMKPHYDDPLLDILRQRGDEHEKAYIDHLRSQGLTIHEFPDDPSKPYDVATAETLDAMKAGPDVIVQGVLADGRWGGRSDVLIKVDTPCEVLGDWSYEVVDTKLARDTKGGTILQLALYSDILAQLQGGAPESMYVVTPGTDFTAERYRVKAYEAYYRLVKARLEDAVSDINAEPVHYPEPCAQCDICAWSVECDRKRRKDDHLSLVAGISRLQRRELESREVTTLESLAKMPIPLTFNPDRGSKESYERVREQARVQLEGRTKNENVYEILENVEAGQGFGRLPEPSEGDVFFDFEGDPFIGEHGREYLFGYSMIENGKPRYESLWAFTEAEEKQAFEDFIDAMMKRWERWDGFHIYHYAPYEPAAIKRLMGRYATGEEEVDRLLRGQRFVDLYAVVRQSLRASVESYSIKKMEPFFDFERDVDLKKAGDHRHALQHALELGKKDLITDEMRETTEGYNKDDCISTFHLQKWLEKLRSAEVERGVEIPRPVHDPDGDASEQLDDKLKAIRELRDRLHVDISPAREERDELQQASWLLGHMLEWHRRENKSDWWEFYRLKDVSDDDMVDESVGIGKLEFVERVEKVKRSFVDRYRFPEQDAQMDEGDELKSPHIDEGRWGTVYALDLAARTIDVKKGPKLADVHVTSAFVYEVFKGDAQAASLFQLGEWVAENGVDADDDSNRAARDLLLRYPPRLTLGASLATAGESSLAAARRLALQVDGGVLPIQGPPGSGKTYTGARMIVDLVRAGKKVGITANSHKVIRNLARAAWKAGADPKEGVDIRCIHKCSKSDEEPPSYIVETRDNDRVAKVLADGEFQVALGTAWLWARPEMAESVDVLFIDEAGQMALANALSVAPAARNVVLLGDPQQLDQPQKGSQPEGTEVSVLEHILGGDSTMPDDRGMFLGETYRLAPRICSYTSELFYESRLQSVESARKHKLLGDGAVVGAGLWFDPVMHDGNQNRSPEEVARVAELVAMLTPGFLKWQNHDGKTAPVELNDIVIVAPYNVQVNAIRSALPEGARVGTVDKFQGQEAPISIFSLATSSQEEAPRGMEFLYSLNRLNVATSRAKCATILVASPRLLEAECRSPRQIQLANALCRFTEMAEVLV